MTPDESPPAGTEGTTPAPPAPRRRRTDAAAKPTTAPDASGAPAAKDAAPAKDAEPKKEQLKVPRRAELAPELRALLGTRDLLDRRRPKFVRQAAHRYERIGRDEAWRRPRGLQSKQRRHYGYRSKIVRVGYRSPADVRGLVPSGFRPVLIRTRDELDGLDARRDAAVIGRTVGTRRRLVLEEEARRLGIRVLNPVVKGEEEK